MRRHCPTDTGFEIRALAIWGYLSVTEMKWNESGFRPPLCTYRLNWARRTSWGWWDDWGDTVLQTQDSKFEPWRSEAEHATSRSRRLPTILTFTRGWRRNIFVSFKPPRPRTEPRNGHGGSPQYWIFTSELGRNILFLWNLNARAGDEPAIFDFPSRQLLPGSKNANVWKQRKVNTIMHTIGTHYISVLK